MNVSETSILCPTLTVILNRYYKIYSHHGHFGVKERLGWLSAETTGAAGSEICN